MDGTLIATTQNAQLQALGTGGQLAVQAWGQITGHLRRTRGAAHAALFAEPNPDADRGVTDWYAEGSGNGTPLELLPEAEREAARAEFTRLYDGVHEESEALRRSTRESERFLGELLALALVTPTTDSLRVVGGRPVLVAWAQSPAGAAPAPELLVSQRAGRTAAAATPGAAPMRIVGPPAPVRRRPSGMLAAAGAVLLLLLLAPVLLWADPLRWFEAPPPQCAIAPGGVGLLNDLRAEEAREGALRAEIARLSLSLGDRRVACPAPPPVAAPRAAAPVQPPAPQPRSADAERAREQGARAGRIQVILAWDDRNDLDLSVACPGGQRIFFGNRSACGGELDLDQNAGGTSSPRPVENIVFEQEPARGSYRIVVHNFRHNPPAPRESPFRVTVRQEGVPDRVLTGSVAPGSAAQVGGFDVPAR